MLIKKMGVGVSLQIDLFRLTSQEKPFSLILKNRFLQWWRKHSKVQVVNGERRTLDILQCGSGQRVQRLAAIQ